MQNDMRPFSDIVAALRLLSRLPLPYSHHAAPDPDAAWAWPLAGMVIAGLAVALGMAAMPFGAGVAAAVVLGAQAMLTGAMHEDGLADTCDGLWGGWDKARRLAIMKDSHIGTYGVMGLLVVGLVRWQALAVLLAEGDWGAVIAIGALSRVPMAILMAGMENARGAGLSQSVGRPSIRAATMAAAIGVVLGGMAFGFGVVLVAIAVCAAALALAAVAKAKVGGQTGDILGASQQLAEAAALAIAVSLI